MQSCFWRNMLLFKLSRYHTYAVILHCNIMEVSVLKVGPYSQFNIHVLKTVNSKQLTSYWYYFLKKNQKLLLSEFFFFFLNQKVLLKNRENYKGENKRASSLRKSLRHEGQLKASCNIFYFYIQIVTIIELQNLKYFVYKKILIKL